MNIACTLLLVTLLAALPAAAQTAPVASPATALPSVDLPPALDRVLRDYETAWSQRDATALALLFAEDGFVLPNGEPPVRGRKAVEAFYRGQGGPLFLRALAFAVDGRTGFILGAYSRSQGSPDEGKFTLTLRQGEDGRWLIVSDMDNGIRHPSSAPPEPAETFLGNAPGPFVALSVANLEAEVAWYRDVLGFTVFSQGVAPPNPRGEIHFALLQQGSALLEILQLPDAKPRSEAAPKNQEAVQIHGFFKSGFVVQDLDGLYARLRAKKVTFAFELTQPPNGPYRVFGVRDPEGNLLQFFGL